jgi:hypothetical protein
VPFPRLPLLLRLWSRRAITSLPLSLRRPRCSHAMHGYKRRPPHCISSAPAPLSASSKSSPPCSPLFSTTPSVPSHLTRPLYPCAGPGASPCLRAAPRPEGPASLLLLSSGAVDHAGELRFSAIHPPRCDLVPWIMSGRCVKGHGCAPWTPSHGRPVAGRLCQCHTARHRRALRPVWTSMWSIHGLRFGPCRAWRCPVARVCTLAQPGRRLAAGEPPRAVPRHVSPPAQTKPCPVGRTVPGMFGAVAGLRQAQRTLCMWAALGFRPSGCLKLENSFSIFFWFQFEFKL